MPDAAEEEEFRLRLFASVDLIGSTAYKAAEAVRQRYEWVPFFTEFFEEFPHNIKGQYVHKDRPEYPPGTCDRPASALEPWKFLGDEILFSAVLARHEDVACHVWAVLNAMKEFVAEWSDRGLPLRLKAAAWLAGFPVTNRAVLIVRPNGAAIEDYIGPSIDLGFRLAKFAEETKFVLSADLALMLMEAADSLAWEKHFHPVLHGKEVLKGVIENRAYPVTYLHTNLGKPTLEEELLGTAHASNPTRLKEYLRHFLGSHGRSLFRPFIENDPSGKYGTIPEEIFQRRETLRQQERGPDYAVQNDAAPEIPDPPAEPKPPDPPPDLAA